MSNTNTNAGNLAPKIHTQNVGDGRPTFCAVPVSRLGHSQKLADFRRYYFTNLQARADFTLHIICEAETDKASGRKTHRRASQMLAKLSRNR